MMNNNTDKNCHSNAKSVLYEKSGITLVALVVTIIVLLILAGITLKVAIGENSLIEQAKKEKQNIENKQETHEDYISHLEEELQKEATSFSANIEKGTNFIILTNVKMSEYSENVDFYEFYLKDDNGDYNKLASSSNDGVEIRGLTHNKLYEIKIVAKSGEDELVSVEKTIKTDKLLCADLTMITVNDGKDYEPNSLTSSNVRVSLVDKNQNAINTYLSLEDSAQTISATSDITEINKSGKTKIRVETTDGTNTVTSSEYVVYIDNEAPIITTATATTNSITITGTDNVSGIVGYAITTTETVPTNYTEIANTTSFTTTINGRIQGTTYYIWLKDALDNVSQGKAVATITVAELNSSNTNFSYSPANWTRENVNVTITTTITDYTLQYSLNGTDWINYTEAITKKENGPIYARVVDTTGQTAKGHATGNVANIDRVGPNNFTPTATRTMHTITISGSTTDVPKTSTNGCSGVNAYYFSSDNGKNWVGGTTSTSYTFKELNQGTIYSVKMKAIDKAGNEVITGTVNIKTLAGVPEFTYTGTYEIVNDDDTPYTAENVNWKIRFLTSGTLVFTKLNGAEEGIDTFLVGGGGNGGGAYREYINGYCYSSAGGGGGGGYCKTVRKKAVQENVSYNITIGGARSSTSAFQTTASGGSNGGNGVRPDNDYSGGAGGAGGAYGGRGAENAYGGLSDGADGQYEFGGSTGKRYGAGGAGGQSYNGAIRSNKQDRLWRQRWCRK